MAGPEKAEPETDDREDSTEVLEPPAVGHQMAQTTPPTARQLEDELGLGRPDQASLEAHDWSVDRVLGLLTSLPSVHGAGPWSEVGGREPCSEPAVPPPPERR